MLNKRYLIFGGTGSLGRKLIDRLLPNDSVAVYSRDESKHWTIKNELSNVHDSAKLKRLKFFVGDVRDSERVADAIRQFTPDRVIIASALKHVDTCELSPFESVQTNVLGVENVLKAIASVSKPPESVLLVSTDKACSPINVYGMCKALAERLVVGQAQTGRGGVRYLVVRYGNVLESRGSIIPLFKHQALHAERLTVTDPEMTRFVMTLEESVDLILSAFDEGRTGETWVRQSLISMRIGDLADIFARKHRKEIRVVGSRPGEKMHEDLINASEIARSRFIGEHVIIEPSFGPVGQPRSIHSPRMDASLTSQQNVADRQALEAYLERLGILDAPLEAFKGTSIDELATGDDTQ